MENNLGQVVLVKDINSGNTIQSGDELLMTLNGVNTELLTRHDFIEI